MAEPASDLFDLSGGKLLTFMIENQEYGIKILAAREVVGMATIDPIPQTPNFMKGIINLRGKIIPVIDLRLKFKIDETADNKESCILVVNIEGKLTGTIIDFLVGVVTIEKSDFEETPDLGSNIDTDYIEGIAKLGKRVIIILNMENILSNDELNLIHEEKQAAPAEKNLLA
ncbi:MAG: chemotaxis protein CheW [Deltaproteobacteria bacterium]|nr:chemotaxis protein CheW [Deltaproteobacteria bacterium]